MREIQHVAMIGLGAVGAVIATQIERTYPHKLNIIADPARRTKLLEQGIKFNGKRYDFSIPETPTPQDLIIVTTKATTLDQAIDQIAPWVGPETIILPLLNGITPVESFAHRYGWARVMRGFYLGHTTSREGQNVEHDGHYYIYMGTGPEHTSQQSEMTVQVANYFDSVGVHYKLPENMLTAQWQKYILNIGTNQSSAMLGLAYGPMQQNPEAWKLTVNLMREAQQVAAALGVEQADELLDRAINSIRNMVPEHRSSMLQDVEAGRPTEISLFAGTLCPLGDKLGVETAENDKVLQFFTEK